MTLLGRQLLTAILVAALMLSITVTPAEAAPSRLRSVLHGLTLQNRFSRFTRTTPVDADKKISEAEKSNVKAAGGVVLETFLFILTIAVVDVTAREIKKEGLKTLSPDHLAAITLKSAHAIVDMPEVYLGLSSATASMGLAKAATGTLGAIFETPSVKAKFVPVLARAASASIGFLGWEFGSQLWTEAGVSLSKEDYEISKSFLGLGSGVAKTMVAAGGAQDRERARVAGLMVRNMIRILFVESDLRSTWMSNTWRLHVMTGDFAALLAAMIAAGEVGAKWGRWRGFLAGVVLGAATLAIPRAPKDAVTGFFQVLRSRADDAKLRENAETLVTLTRDPAKFRLILKNRRAHREAIATIAFERIHRAIATRDATLFTAEIDGFATTYWQEIEALRTLKAKTPAMLHSSLDQEISNVATLADFANLLREGGVALAKDGDFKQIADANNSRGFSEAAILEQMRAE